MLASARRDLDVFNPDLVVLGGGVTNAGDSSSGPSASSAPVAMPPMVAPAEIVLAELGDQLGVRSRPSSRRASRARTASRGTEPRPA